MIKLIKPIHQDALNKVIDETLRSDALGQAEMDEKYHKRLEGRMISIAIETVPDINYADIQEYVQQRLDALIISNTTKNK